MKVRCLRNTGRGLPPMTEGWEGEMDAAEAERLIKRGLVESLEPKPQKPAVITAPASAPAIAGPAPVAMVETAPAPPAPKPPKVQPPISATK